MKGISHLTFPRQSCLDQLIAHLSKPTKCDKVSKRQWKNVPENHGFTLAFKLKRVFSIMFMESLEVFILSKRRGISTQRSVKKVRGMESQPQEKGLNPPGVVDGFWSLYEQYYILWLPKTADSGI